MTELIIIYVQNSKKENTTSQIGSIVVSFFGLSKVWLVTRLKTQPIQMFMFKKKNKEKVAPSKLHCTFKCNMV